MYEILTYLLNSGYENVDLVDGKPAVYVTLEEAKQELEEFLIDTLEAFQEGNLQEPYTPEGYLIKHTKTYETYHVVWNSDKSGIKLINPEDFIKAS